MEKSLEISCSQKPSMVLKLISIWFDIISLFVSTMVIFKFIIFPKHWCNPINEIYHILHGFKARGSSKWIQITLVDTNLWKTEKVVTLSTQQKILLLDIFNMGRWILPKKKKKHGKMEMPRGVHDHWPGLGWAKAHEKITHFSFGRNVQLGFRLWA